MLKLTITHKKSDGSIRRQIERDIRNALDHHVTEFEFDGYKNYRTVYSYAREVAADIANREIYKKFRLIKAHDTTPGAQDKKYQRFYITELKELFYVTSKHREAGEPHEHIMIDLSGMNDDNFIKYALKNYGELPTT